MLFTLTLSLFSAPQRSVSSTSLVGMGSHVPPPHPVLLPAALILLRRGLSTVSSPINAWSTPPPQLPSPTNVVIREYLNGYSGSRVKTPKRRFCRMLQKSRGGTFVIPDA